MLKRIESLESVSDQKIVLAMEKAMRADITPEIMKKVLSVDPQIISQKEEELAKSLTKYSKDNVEHDTIQCMYDFFNNWSSNLPDKNYGDGICRYRQANILLEYLDKPNSETKIRGPVKPSDLLLSQTARQFHATVFASLFVEKLDIGKILEMNDETKLKKNEQCIKLNNYTIHAFVRLLALGYTLNDLTQ